MLLKAVVENLSGETLDRFCREAIYRPLGLKTLGFNPLSQPGGDRISFAATEPGLIPGRPAGGEVHDENAWAAAGVAGHAGLFGPGREVFQLLACLYRAYAGECLGPFAPETVQSFSRSPPGLTGPTASTSPARTRPSGPPGVIFPPQRRPPGLHRHLFGWTWTLARW